ncbi:MAG: serine/threonine-protein kinase [Myxococcota bacterium]
MAFRCPTRVGKYHLLRHLNSGGMADLYEGRLIGIENFRRYIAIKVVRPPPDLTEAEATQFLDMFLDEARVCGQLTHANIAQVYELGKVAGLPFMAMELVEGHSLAHLRRRARDHNAPLPLPFVAYVVSQAALGLDYAHRRTALDGSPLNIVHRDVSPDNILVSYEGEVKVIDFGVAQARDQRPKKVEEGLKGKLAYMSPEQAAQAELDGRADIFGLGAILFELLTGTRIYTQKGADLYRAARDCALPDLDQALSAVPEEMRTLVKKALSPDRNDRFASAGDVSQGLKPFTIEERTLFGADDAGQVVASLYPELPNRRGVAPTDAPAEAALDIQTEVFQTFDAAFYKRPTLEVDPEPVRNAAAELGFTSSISLTPSRARSAPSYAECEPCAGSISVRRVKDAPFSWRAPYRSCCWSRLSQARRSVAPSMRNSRRFRAIWSSRRTAMSV